MTQSFFDAEFSRITTARTRSLSAENPTGAPGGGAAALPGSDPSCTPASREMGRGWKVRPCLKGIEPGQTVTLADIRGSGIVQHIWCTAFSKYLPWMALEITYDDATTPSINVPLGHFFANGIDGGALIASLPVAVNPRGGMNSYWPMPFRRGLRMTVRNDGPESIPELFYQVTWSEQEVANDAGYLHVAWNRSMTRRENPEHVLLERVRGRGSYVGTYIVWSQLSNHWWGEGEVKFFQDGDADDAPSICGTGTEDYFGGAWGFVMDHEKTLEPHPYSTPYLGYPQAIYGFDPKKGPLVPTHGLYRWHLPDPVRFQENLRVTVQALGWWVDKGTYQPLTDDIASTAFWYHEGVHAVPTLPVLTERLPR